MADSYEEALHFHRRAARLSESRRPQTHGKLYFLLEAISNAFAAHGSLGWKARQGLSQTETSQHQ